MRNYLYNDDYYNFLTEEEEDKTAEKISKSVSEKIDQQLKYK